MRIGGRGAKSLKVAHLVFTALWLGGAAALGPLALSVDPADPEAAVQTYTGLRTIAWNVVGWGGIGSFASGIALGLFTPWGIFKQGWTIAKLALTVWGIGFGMFFVERNMLLGLAILQAEGGTAAAAFAGHHASFKLGLFAQLSTLFLILAIAVFKPRAPSFLRRGPRRRGGRTKPWGTWRNRTGSGRRCTGLLAALRPARRGLAVEPTEALRQEE